MSDEYNLNNTQYPSLYEASQTLFRIISERLNVNTAYVTRRGKNEMTVLSSFNDREDIIPEGYSVEYGGTYCRMIISDENSAMTTPDLTKNLLTSQLEVTDQLGVKGFLGVTLRDREGGVFGTLCVMDQDERSFSEEDIQYLHSLSGVLSHMIELDQVSYNMAYLNVPIIPITPGVSVLSVQGIVDSRRSDIILSHVLQYCTDHQVHTFIIDLSGLVILNDQLPQALSDLAQALRVMGIRPIITGITPEIAKHDLKHAQLTTLHIETARSLEQAMALIGFSLTETTN
ncbi:anti-sigma factor antagonist [Jeotgalibacillus alimentarius]|uniref:Anti-sigma factor antagonist n=1 Tax=Jeotgalibacillus alimentarius TaxID=135826 RepID=A0A0C2RPC5_9BACL|nr:STAS domain-containing protein [Jeotgalibacillus alimentarius]KIL43599.1 anti-sigma factor antagonist [Jeotgalibacillus alimentarius]